MQVATCSDTSINMCSYYLSLFYVVICMYEGNLYKMKEWGVGNRNKDRKKIK